MGLLSSIGKAVSSVSSALSGSSWIGPAISAAGSLLGGMNANSANMAMFQGSQQWQEKMYGQRYQMQVDDMKKAGLNPMLSYNAAPPQVANPTAPPQQDALTPAINSANSTKLIQAQMQQMDAQSQAALATAKNQEAQAENNSADAALKRGQYVFTYGDPFVTEGGSSVGGTPVYPVNKAFQELYQNMNNMDLTKAQTAYQKELKEEIQPRIQQLISQGKFNEASAELARVNTTATRLGLPKIKAESDAYSGIAGNILPYLPGFSSTVNSANGLKQFLKGR